MFDGRRPLLIAAGLAIFAGVLAFVGFAQREKQMTQGWELVPAVVASRNIREGEELTQDNVKASLIPERFFTGSVIRPDDVGRGSVLHQKAAVAMAEGDPLLWTHIATSAATARLAQTITNKGRAVAIRVSPESSVQNWVRPSDHVDVLTTMRDPTSGDHVTLTLLENVIVLATGTLTGTQVTGADHGYSTVTLQVMPEAAEMLVLAQELGSLYLTLRNPEDTDIGESHATATSLRTIASGERTHMISQKQTKQFQNIEIIRGGRTSETKRFPSKP
jgi:pilus assembly protein CpaB